MMHTRSTDILKASGVIAKTTETVMGGEINVSGYDFLTLFVVYTKGDETGVNIYPYFLRVSAGDEYPFVVWTASTGTYTAAVAKLQLAATAKRAYTFDVRGIEIVKFYQGGSNNDGTPTGTIAAAYTMS